MDELWEKYHRYNRLSLQYSLAWLAVAVALTAAMCWLLGPPGYVSFAVGMLAGIFAGYHGSAVAYREVYGGEPDRLTAWWRRSVRHRATCYRCHQLVPIGLPHDRPHPCRPGLSVRCEEVAL